jgi:putative photosynthetic complex assembly protein
MNNTLPAPRTRGLPIGWLIGLMAVNLLAVGLARWQGWHVQVQDAPTVWEMSLKFEDMPDGSVRVSDATDGRPLAVFAGEQGFLRGSLRAMARQRRVAQAERGAPLLLRALADGRLVLIDPTQGERIDLDSFGPSNKAVFAGLRGAATKSLESGEKR